MVRDGDRVARVRSWLLGFLVVAALAGVVSALTGVNFSTARLYVVGGILVVGAIAWFLTRDMRAVSERKAREQQARADYLASVEATRLSDDDTAIAEKPHELDTAPDRWPRMAPQRVTWVPVDAVRMVCDSPEWLAGTSTIVGTPTNTALALVNAAAMFRVAEGRSKQTVMADLIAAGMPDLHVRSMTDGIDEMWTQAKRAMGTSSAYEYARSDLLQRERAFAQLSRSPGALGRTAPTNRYMCARCGQVVAAISVISNPQTGGFDEVCGQCLRSGM